MTDSGDRKPKVVDVDPDLIESVLEEEKELEDRKYDRLMRILRSK